MLSPAVVANRSMLSPPPARSLFLAQACFRLLSQRCCLRMCFARRGFAAFAHCFAGAPAAALPNPTGEAAECTGERARCP
eukprot:13909757-Alexandrium_andersonii.AAC.1